MSYSFNVAQFLVELARNPHYQNQIAHIAHLPEQAPRYGELSRPLPDFLQLALKNLGINELYTHQAAAIETARDGKSFVVVTATASGKTLCYHLPILERRLEEPGAKALYLYPTKALAQDQLRGLLRLQEAGDMSFKCGTYDGDTASSTRSSLRDRADLILTNPDMLHAGILPNHAKWAHFFEQLRFVVIDEVHTYRGIFGSNVANVMRRLKRICSHYGANPQFICASATIANPQELCEKLCNEKFASIEDDGAPRGQKQFVLWNPPIINDEQRTRNDESSTRSENLSSIMSQAPASPVRRSANSEAQHLLTNLMKRGVPTIAFVRARVVAELLLRYTQDDLAKRAPQLLEKVRAYRAGYLASERREIEQKLFNGELLGVIATSALELGIDVGDLDACILVGYPGSISSTWQRAGRAGRSQSDSLAILVAGDGPIDQYLMHHPDYLFGRAHEHAVIDADNAYILAKHLRCACAELPCSLEEARKMSQYAPALLQLLEEEKQLRRAGRSWFWASAGVPSRDVSLRNIGDNSYSIVDADRQRAIGTVDETTAFQTVHSGAIYLHDAETYHIEKLDLSTRTAWARRHDADYFTQALSEASIRIESVDEEKTWRDSTIGFGAVGVTISITSYKKMKFGSLDTLGYGTLELPPQTLDTSALWIAPPPEGLRRLREMGRVPLEGMLGIANAAVGVMPLRVMCDGNDIGAVVDSTQLGTPALFIYDKYSGGLGLAQRAFDLVESLFSAAHQLISECECADGCPSCVGSARKTYTYYDAEGAAHERLPDKEAALVVLHEILGLEPYQTRDGEHRVLDEPIEQLPDGLEGRVRKQLQRLKGV